MDEPDVLIVGAGLSGLSCAVELKRQGKSFRILEASDDVGGRVRTDHVDGYRLDRGFQVFLTAYPEAKRVLDYDSLHFKSFKSGALIRYNGGFCRVSDVVRHPGDLPGNLFSKAASLVDKLKIAALRSEVGKLSIKEIAELPNITTKERLRDFGFSEKIIGTFFRPFFGGVFLESNLATSRRMFDFVFKMFAEGEVAIPALGMGEISRQLAASLGDNCIEYRSKVVEVSANSVKTADGQIHRSDKVVVAVDKATASELAGNSQSDNCGVTCLYFSANQSPVNEPILVLNGDEEGPINNLCVPSDVSDHYAPQGKALVSITVLGVAHADGISEQVLQQAKNWYGDQVDSWNLIRTYTIPRALPNQSVNKLETVCKPLINNGIHYCGDYLSFASIQGAMETGRLVAEADSQ